MHLDEYQALASRTRNNELKPTDQVTNMLLGLAGETGELADTFKKAWYQGHGLSETDIINEAGDILWYLAGILSVFGLSLENVAQTNIDKLKARYPTGFSEQASRERTA